MIFPTLLLTIAAYSRLAHADFYIITEAPIPLSLVPTTFSNQADEASWTTSVVFNAEISFARYRRSQGPEYQSSVDSVKSELSEFAQTASGNYSIPPEVADPDQTTRIIGKPSWYDALPTGVKSFKEEEWEVMKSIASEVVAARITTSRSVGGGIALPTPAAGLQNAGWAVAGAAAAVFL
ncbi:hypothetical protein M011DRAFT_475651 [Sporormia fimetaria CBS 119925]|uniref:Uncharacterized protein n=1 Tax=Sporormia fimetaria CBS 119925 TaxID=1340428 RepID=A0A6A6VIP0_9PLEO|nr:hypothetical protein M011DRAFT_475651 [Sporormia fimetaria CBS 119925]